MSEIAKLYQARNIITMDDDVPSASHVAVADGRIVAVGGAELEVQFGSAETTFASQVLVPGFVEGHAHVIEGATWKHPYVGFYDRMHPDGDIHQGCQTVDDLVARLVEIERNLKDPGETLFAWGYDAIYFDNKPMRWDLDRVSSRRPIVVVHSNGHLITVNSLALEKAGINASNAVDGVYLDDNGEPNGELAEMAAMFPVFHAVGNPFFDEMNDPEDIRRFAQCCHRAGVTTTTDLYNPMPPQVADLFESTTSEPGFPARIVPAIISNEIGIEETIKRAKSLAQRGNDKLFMGQVKIVSDGSIQGYSARVRQPYVTGVENGVWYSAPSQLQEMILRFHTSDIKMHIHVNGDEASELVLQTFETVFKEHGRRQTHVMQHAQMMDRDQLTRASNLGIMVNMFANHTYYWGDQHRDSTVGPEIAPRMNAARTALDVGLDVALHCDAPVTPMRPAFTMWCAVNRKTASGRDHGPEERISAAQALRAVTLAPAISIDLADKIGSITPGKFADFTALDQDPLIVDPMAIRDINVLGTMLGGVWQPAN